jgi:hypothetical protein
MWIVHWSYCIWWNCMLYFTVFVIGLIQLRGMLNKTGKSAKYNLDFPKPKYAAWPDIKKLQKKVGL